MLAGLQGLFLSWIAFYTLASLDFNSSPNKTWHDVIGFWSCLKITSTSMVLKPATSASPKSLPEMQEGKPSWEPTLDLLNQNARSSQRSPGPHHLLSAIVFLPDGRSISVCRLMCIHSSTEPLWPRGATKVDKSSVWMGEDWKMLVLNHQG